MRQLRGAEVSAKIKEQVQAGLAELTGLPPKLAIVRVGDKPDDLSYERGAKKKLESFGLRVQSYAYPEKIGDADFFRAFCEINADPEVTGILLLLPLPTRIRMDRIRERIDPDKDMDGISPVNLAKIFAGDPDGFAPCTAEAVVDILKENGILLAGQRVTVVGRSMVVGRPLSMLLLKENATVTICHTRTRDLEKVCRKADILVACAGQKRMIDRTYVKDQAIVVDVGIHVDESGTLCGDVAYEDICGTASMATPVPGGVGSVTTAVLAKHLLQAAQRAQRRKEMQ